MNHFSADSIRKPIECAVGVELQERSWEICDLAGGQLFSCRFEGPLISWKWLHKLSCRGSLWLRDAEWGPSPSGWLIGNLHWWFTHCHGNHLNAEEYICSFLHLFYYLYWGIFERMIHFWGGARKAIPETKKTVNHTCPKLEIHVC